MLFELDIFLRFLAREEGRWSRFCGVPSRIRGIAISQRRLKA